MMNKKYETVEGCPARIICTDRKSENYPILALYTVGHTEHLVQLTEDLTLDPHSTKPKLIEVDPLRDLKRAQSEGAEIEFYSNLKKEWVSGLCISWEYKPKRYRIKGGITIESWDMHKDVIKEFWKGNTIEILSAGEWIVIPYPTFLESKTYRVKSVAKRLTIKEIAKKFGVDNVEIIEDTKEK